MRKCLVRIIVGVIAVIALILCICIYPLCKWAYIPGHLEAEATYYDMIPLTSDITIRQELYSEFQKLDSISLYMVPQVPSESGYLVCNVLDEEGNILGSDRISMSKIIEYMKLTFHLDCNVEAKKVYTLEFGFSEVPPETTLIFIANPKENLPIEYQNMYVDGIQHTKALLFYTDYLKVPSGITEANRIQNLIIVPAIIMIILLLGWERKYNATKD